MWLFKKYVTYIMAFVIPFTCISFALSPPLCYTLFFISIRVNWVEAHYA